MERTVSLFTENTVLKKEKRKIKENKGRDESHSSGSIVEIEILFSCDIISLIARDISELLLHSFF